MLALSNVFQQKDTPLAITNEANVFGEHSSIRYCGVCRLTVTSSTWITNKHKNVKNELKNTIMMLLS